MVTGDLPEFFKVYIRQYTFQQMMFPSEFVDYTGLRKSGMAELVGSNGKTWRVELVYEENELYFADGWKEFVNDNLIRDGNFMFFKYRGSLVFSVVIYDESMCEKEMKLVDKYSHGRDAIPEMEIKQEKNEVETGLRRSARRPSPKVSKTLKHTAAIARPFFEKTVSISYVVIPASFLREHSLSYKSNEKMVMRTSRDSSWEVKIINNHSKARLCSGWRAFARENAIRKGDFCKFELLDRLEMMVHVVNEREGIQQEKINVATPKIEAQVSQPRANYDGQKATSKTMPSYVKPSFDLVMKKYNVEITFLATIPKWFSQENSLQYGKNEKVILQIEKDSIVLPVNIIQDSTGRYSFSVGWSNFIHCNNIKIGDTCKFELVNRLEMKVHITRAPQNCSS